MHTQYFNVYRLSLGLVSHDFRRMSFRGEHIVVPGTQLDIAIPYRGDPMLWRIRASSFTLSGYPEILIRDDEIVFSISFPDDSADPKKLKQQIECVLPVSLREKI